MEYRRKFENRVREILSGKYEIELEIGTGGMGRVYKALDTDTGKTVALKIIRPEHIYNDKMVKRFRKEVELAVRVKHSSVVNIHSFYSVEDIHCIVMDYIEGETLGQILDTGNLTPETAVSIAMQILEGLNAAHEKGIIHRDLKPQNIIVDRDGKVTITDFGLAREVDSTRLTATSGLMGTPQYIAPEQWIGERPDNRTDIYSFGVLLYEMVFGHLPFKSTKDYGYMDMHLHKPVSFPSDNSNIPGYLKAVILKCLEKKPGDRYQAVSAIIKDFKRKKATGSFKTVLRNRFRKTSKAIWITSLLILAITVGFIFTRSDSEEKPIPPAPKQENPLTLAVLFFKNKTQNKALDFLERGIPFLLTEDLVQSKYMYTAKNLYVYLTLKDSKKLDRINFSKEDIKELSKLIGVKYLITGNIEISGKNILLNIRINDSETGEFLFESSEAIRQITEIYKAVDKLTWKIKKTLLSSINFNNDHDSDIEKITTGNMQALKHYLEGQNISWKNRYNKECERLFQKAISLDENFALAYDSLRSFYSFGYDEEKAENVFEILLSKKEHLSRRHQFFFYAAYYAKKNEFEKATKLLEECMNEFPYDKDIHILLASIYSRRWFFKKSEKIYENLARVYFNAKIVQDLFAVYMYKGEIKKYEKLLIRTEKVFPTTFWIYYFKWTLKIVQQKYVDAKCVLINSGSYERNLYKLNAHLSDQLRGDFTELEEKYCSLKEKKMNLRDYTKLYSNYSSMHMAQGNIMKALNVIGEGISNTKNRDVKILLGIHKAYFLSKIEFSRALKIIHGYEKLARESKSYQSEPNLIFFKYFYNKSSPVIITSDELRKLRGLVEDYNDVELRFCIKFLEGILEQNVEKLEASYKTYPKEGSDTNNYHALLLDQVLRIYLKKGDEEGILKTCNKIQNLTFGRVLYGDIYALSFYHQGKTLLKLNRKSEAIKALRKFHTLFKEGDRHIFPQIEETEKLLGVH